jgi:hypothetical protein
MATYYLQFESRALVGQDEAYSRWYNEVHVADVLRIPGFKRLAGHYRIVADDPQPRYLALYEIASENPRATLAALLASADRMSISSALDPTHVHIRILEPCHS